MNIKRRIFLMSAAAVLLASCSRDDTLQSTVNINEGLKPMTITASLPTDGMQTRATGDAAAARCYMQILNGNGTELEDVQILNGDGTELEDGNSKPIPMDPDGGSFTTTVFLKGDNTYDFLFWADTETTTDQNVPTDLTAVAYTNNGQTIAWAGNIEDKVWDAEGIEIDLEHVVSRVTVITTSNFTVDGDYPLTVTVPTVYGTYNVKAGAVVEDSEVPNGYMLDVTDGPYTADTEVAHFYVLGDGNQDLNLWYKGPKENDEITITGVPVSANTHITLKGDIYNAGLVNGNIIAITTTGWDTPETGDIPFK